MPIPFRTTSDLLISNALLQSSSVSIVLSSTLMRSVLLLGLSAGGRPIFLGGIISPHFLLPHKVYFMWQQKVKLIVYFFLQFCSHTTPCKTASHSILYGYLLGGCVVGSGVIFLPVVLLFLYLFSFPESSSPPEQIVQEGCSVLWKFRSLPGYPGPAVPGMRCAPLSGTNRPRRRYRPAGADTFPLPASQAPE